MENNVSKFYRSFSGTDSLVFILLPYTTPVCLGTITTISYSMFRDKKPVPLIGKINVGGFTRGTRIVAGTMIFTLINQHWVNELVQQVPWLKKYGKIKADELPLFDIMILSANEYGASVQMFLYGVDITDEGQVLSVEDLFTENQFSFVARDMDTFSDTFYTNENLDKATTIKNVTDFDLKYDSALNPDAFQSDWVGPKRNLKLNSSDIMTGEDVLNIQHLLNSRGIDSPMNGVYDTKTFEAVRTFQSQMGLSVTGAIDDKTYMALTNSDIATNPSGVIITKAGAVSYEQPSTLSRIVTVVNYKENVEILDKDGDWVLTDKGYIPSHQVYMANNKQSYENFPSLRYGDKGPEVTMLQDGLNIAERLNLALNGIMDRETVDAVKGFEEKNKMPVDGIVDSRFWMTLQEKVENLTPDMVDYGYGFDMDFAKPPKNYTVDDKAFKPSEYGVTAKNISKDTNVKVSAISHYPKGESMEFTKTITILKGDKDKDITAEIMSEAFMFNPQFKSTPNYVEFIIFTTNGKPIKWSFNIE